LERKTTEPSRSLSAIVEFLVLRVPICNFSIFVMVKFGTIQGPISPKCLVKDYPDYTHTQSLGIPSVP